MTLICKRLESWVCASLMLATQPNKNCIGITSFVKQSDIDPVFYEKSYFIEPEEAAKRPFLLFMRAMQEKGMTAIAKVAICSKERL